MIVRTYGRRTRPEEEEDPYGFNEEDEEGHASFSLSQNSNKKNQDLFDFTFSSQDSTRCRRGESWDDTCPSPLQLLAPVEKVVKKRVKREEKGLAPTATLMETQEYGEMMECVDEVDFALDGLKKGHSLRVRRASLLSLLTVCGDFLRRRLLKAQGIAKTIIDAVLDINLDDSPSNLAAATLFYILTSDDQDRYLLDSSSSIRFLLQLLKPVSAAVAVDKAPSISQKLLALGKELRISHDTTKKPDLSSTELIHKVLDTLVTCKDLKANNEENNDMSRPELNANWVSLLTMEKACMSTISIEDTSGTMRKSGGNFKENLRELGGLDAIFKLVVNLHSTLEGLVEHGQSIRESKEGSLQCLPLLLKCLKIMENATFLSKENQSHLLGLKQSLAGRGSSLSFVKLMLNFIDVLSDLTLLRISSASSSPEMPVNHTNRGYHCAEFISNTVPQVENNRILPSLSSQECSSSGRYSADLGFHRRSLQSNGGSTRSKTGNHVIEISSSSESGSLMMDMSPSLFGSCSFTPKGSDSGENANCLGSKTNLCLSKRPCDYDDDVIIDLEESQDPFAFDEDDCMQSKWDVLPGKRRKGRQNRKNKTAIIESEDRCLSRQMLIQDECQSLPMLSQEELGAEEQKEGLPHSSDTSCTTVIDEEKSSLVADCLLTAIKVLMNLTNDNAVGCREIGACGGLETLSSLIARHFPSFRTALLSEINDITRNSVPEVRNQTDAHLSDQDLDFLVTILGLLVNMVENDANNRSTLATTKVALPCSGGLDEVNTGMIPLLCCIFMANRGAGETAEEELQSWDEEEVVLQGEKEAEQMIVEAYSALLLAFLSTESKSVRDTISSHLPDRSLKVLVPVLDRFVTFHLTLNMISPETHKTVSEVIESCRLP